MECSIKPNKNDMTQGSILKHVFWFALPICLGNVLQQLYSTVDTLVVGNYCGSVSLAAIGTSAQPVEMLLCIFLGIGSGVSILAAQNIGRNDLVNLKQVVATAISFLYIITIPVSLVGIFLGPWLLRFMQVPSEAFDGAVSYVRIVFLGTLGNMGYNLNAGILRGMGDSSSSLLFLVVSCVMNILLDLLFVGVFHLDVSGAALATAVSMFASWLLSIFYITKKYPELEFTILPRRLYGNHMLHILKVGVPLGVNNSLYSVGHIFMQSVINAQGSIFMAACSVAGKVTGLSNVAITSLSSAATTFAGQNLGARNYKRLKQGAWQIILVSGAVTCTAGLVVTFFFCDGILGLFTKEGDVLAFASRYVHIVLPFSWMYAVLNCIICFANGLGEIRYPTIVNLLMLWVVRIPVGYMIDYFFDGTYCMVCFPVSFSFGMLGMFCFFFTKKWREVRKMAK